MRRDCSNESSGSAGISAMIIFVALILVSAVVSIVVFQFSQELFNHSEQDAEDTQVIIQGKIMVMDATLTAIELDNNENPLHATIQITLEMSPGTPDIQDDEIKWAVLCEKENTPHQTRWSNEGNLESITTATGSGSDPGAVDVVEVGITYMITLSLHHTTDTDNDDILDQGGCPPNYLETHTLIFAMGNSGSYTSWDLRYDEKLETGDRII